jgi:hypothetical protein
MARFPAITSACPLRWSTLPQAGRDHCGHCDRQVHNLDAMTPGQREAFLGGCSGKVCVAYTVQRRVQRRGAQLGAGLLAAMAGSAAMAGGGGLPHGPSLSDDAVLQHFDAGAVAAAQNGAPITVPGSAIADAGALESTEEVYEVMVGGTEGGDNVRWADVDDLAADAPDTLEDIAPSEWLPSRAP